MADIRQKTRSDDTDLQAHGTDQVALSLDQLDYLADLVAELHEMAARAGLTTLAGLLALAQSEAALQVASRK